MRVALVEDHPAFREQLQHRLEDIEGVSVVSMADTDAGALEWLQRHEDAWDVLVLDIFLAQGHGFTVLRGCARRQPHQRVVVLTSYTREPVRERAHAAGADALFDKVLELDHFLAYMQQLRQAA